MRIISDDPAIQAHYERCLAKGTSETLAEMFALAQPPMSNSDREFLAGHCNGSQFSTLPKQGDHYAAIAERAGMDITGKVYLSGLAEYIGDPRAWVSGRGDVQKICEERGYGCEGAVKVKVREPEQAPKRKVIADDLVEKGVNRMLKVRPELKKKHRQELREQYIDQHKGPV